MSSSAIFITRSSLFIAPLYFADDAGRRQGHFNCAFSLRSISARSLRMSLRNRDLLICDNRMSLLIANLHHSIITSSTTAIVNLLFCTVVKFDAGAANNTERAIICFQWGTEMHLIRHCRDCHDCMTSIRVGGARASRFISFELYWYCVLSQGRFSDDGGNTFCCCLSVFYAR